MTDLKISKARSDAVVDKTAPSAGLFGFAGTTLFQPGQPLFSGEPGVLPYTPNAKSDPADKPE